MKTREPTVIPHAMSELAFQVVLAESEQSYLIRALSVRRHCIILAANPSSNLCLKAVTQRDNEEKQSFPDGQS